ncbi:hypothetical protein L6654_03100 [Bradyrhizobium sp. WYCCWR 13023]|uniref:DUF992 domain-containing protein n=1 Tax=Bradyrhizobium zhengyangense TaxID=2911009 RepID=A0A9X1R7C7_9BRAD|nr:hypothetical protein [Bradyrhizobium zhengyangense]MCG2625599.1 hypothetical protein [Bradyrhizobium zhengyangense]
MRNRFVLTVAASALLCSASGVAQSEPIGRYECNIVGAASQDPIGDRDGHRIVGTQYACAGVDGILKGALYTGSSTSEWDGPKGRYLNGIGLLRSPNGVGVTLVTEGAGSAVMKDGKPVGSEATGKAVYQLATGVFAPLSGKSVKWAVQPAGFNRFSLEVMTDDEVTTAAAKQ